MNRQRTSLDNEQGKRRAKGKAKDRADSRFKRAHFTPVRLLSVFMRFGGESLLVGRLAWVERRILFEFAKDFPQRLNPSPFRLRQAPGAAVIPGPERIFEGLHGVFNDSLPDGWGRLLMDRKLRAEGVMPGELTPLDRLAWVGSRGMGVLEYQPEHPSFGAREGEEALDLDVLARQARLVLEDDAEAVLDQLLRAGGSPGGARPKVLVGCSPDRAHLVHGDDVLPEGYSHWLVKFGAREDPADMGAIELAYAHMARDAGIVMPEAALFSTAGGGRFFGLKRFDRGDAERVHMLSLSGLLDADFRVPSVGYEELLKATRLLTRRQDEVEQVFARMVFNVFAHNRDDHPKNHSFLMGADGEWRVSPAYDVVFSSGPGGEHALAVAGEGRNPGPEHLLRVADSVGVPRKKAAESMDRVRATLGRWEEIAGQAGVSGAMQQAVAGRLRR